MEKETNLRNRKSKTSIKTTLASNGKSTDIHNAKDDSNSKGKTLDGTGLYKKKLSRIHGNLEQNKMI